MRVAVSGSVLRWALQRSGRYAAIERKFPNLASGFSIREPTLRQLEDLAKATATPLGYFFLRNRLMFSCLSLTFVHWTKIWRLTRVQTF